MKSTTVTVLGFIFATVFGGTAFGAAPRDRSAEQGRRAAKKPAVRVTDTADPFEDFLAAEPDVFAELQFVVAAVADIEDETVRRADLEELDSFQFDTASGEYFDLYRVEDMIYAFVTTKRSSNLFVFAPNADGTHDVLSFARLGTGHDGPAASATRCCEVGCPGSPGELAPVRGLCCRIRDCSIKICFDRRGVVCRIGCGRPSSGGLEPRPCCNCIE